MNWNSWFWGTYINLVQTLFFGQDLGWLLGAVVPPAHVAQKGLQDKTLVCTFMFSLVVEAHLACTLGSSYAAVFLERKPAAHIKAASWTKPMCRKRRRLLSLLQKLATALIQNTKAEAATLPEESLLDICFVLFFSINRLKKYKTHSLKYRYFTDILSFSSLHCN